MISCQGTRRYRNESTGLTVKLGNYKYTKRRLTTVWLTRVFSARGVSCLQASHGYRIESVGLKGKLVNHKSERVRSSHLAGARLFLQGGSAFACKFANLLQYSSGLYMGVNEIHTGVVLRGDWCAKVFFDQALSPLMLP